MYINYVATSKINTTSVVNCATISAKRIMQFYQNAYIKKKLNSTIIYIQYGTFTQLGNISVKRVTFPNQVTKHYPIEEHVTRFGVKKTVIPVISERADGCCKERVQFIYFGIQNTFFPELPIKIKFLPCRFQDKAMIDNMDRNKNILVCSHFLGNPIFYFVRLLVT